MTNRNAQHPACPSCGEPIRELQTVVELGECPVCSQPLKIDWYQSECRRLNPGRTKLFVFDGHRATTLGAFFDEVIRVLCPDFKRFGRNWDAFVDVLRGGFGQFEEGEKIRVAFVNRAAMKRSLEESQYRKIFSIIEESENVELV
ncbi:MAG: barstar family protein [Candidatus Thorarchaeota archaeon]|jgi:hypothetical protein